MQNTLSSEMSQGLKGKKTNSNKGITFGNLNSTSSNNNNNNNNFKVNLLPAVVEEDNDHVMGLNNNNNSNGNTTVNLNRLAKSSLFHAGLNLQNNVSTANINLQHTTSNANVGLKRSIVSTNFNNVNLNQTTSSNNFRQSGMSHSPEHIIKEVETEIKSKEILNRVVLQDTEDRWFLNPQYKLEIKPGLKIMITLMQEDEKVARRPYQKCNFMIIISKSKYSRIWDFKEENLIKKAVESDTG
jgi:hypothetical protein